MSKRRRVNKSLLKKKQKYIVDRGLLHEMYNHLRNFDHKRDAKLTQLEEMYGEAPTFTPKEAKTIGQSNEPRQEAQTKRRELIAIDRMLETGSGPTLQWFKQFIPLVTLEQNIFKRIRLWAAGNNYVFTFETKEGMKVSIDYIGKEAAMYAYDNGYIKYTRFISVPPIPG